MAYYIPCVAATQYTSTETSAEFTVPDTINGRGLQPMKALTFYRNLSAAAAAAGDTLETKVQGKVCGAWVDICRFSDRLGNGGTHIDSSDKILPSTGQSNVNDIDSTTLTQGDVRHLFGESYRVVFTLGGATPDFTVAITAHQM